jgi:hypothetical protein
VSGVDALERLRARYDIQAVLLSYSTVALATAPICEQNKILMLDGGSVSEALVGKFSYLFHNRAVATVLARAALTIPKQQGFKKMAVMAASTDEGQRARACCVCRARTGRLMAVLSLMSNRHWQLRATSIRRLPSCVPARRTSWRSGNFRLVLAWC